MNPEQMRTPPTIEGMDIPPEKAEEEWKFILERGTEALSNTAFVTGEEFKQEDIDALKSFYQEVLEHQEEALGEKGAIFNRSLLEHLSLAERIGKHAADELCMNKHQLSAVLLTHDLGRLFSHRRGRNNVIEAKLSKEFNFSEKFTRLLPPDSLWKELDEEAVAERLGKITTEDKGIIGLVELIDVMAKWKDKNEGVLRKKADLVPLTMARQNLPDKGTMWPSEYARQLKITSATGGEAVSTKYTFLAEWFEKVSGKPLDEFVGQVEQDLKQSPLSNNWVEKSS